MRKTIVPSLFRIILNSSVLVITQVQDVILIRVRGIIGEGISEND